MSKQYTNMTGSAVTLDITNSKSASPQATRSVFARRSLRQQRRSARAI